MVQYQYCSSYIIQPFWRCGGPHALPLMVTVSRDVSGPRMGMRMPSILIRDYCVYSHTYHTFTPSSVDSAQASDLRETRVTSRLTGSGLFCRQLPVWCYESSDRPHIPASCRQCSGAPHRRSPRSRQEGDTGSLAVRRPGQ